MKNARVLLDTGVPFYFTTTLASPNVSGPPAAGPRGSAMGAVNLRGSSHPLLPGGGHLEHQLHVAHAGVVQAGELQVQHLIRRFRGLPFRRRRPAATRQGIRAVAEDLGALSRPGRRAAPSPPPPGSPFRYGAAGLQHPGEAQQLHGGGVVLHRHIGHQGVVRGGLGLAGGDDAADGDPLVVGKPGGAALLGEVLQNGADGGRPSRRTASRYWSMGWPER